MCLRKKGIALIYDPHNLYQFLWYYCTYGKDYDWQALCLPNGAKGEYMSTYCEKSGIFKKIIRDADGAFLTMPMRQRLGVFFQMLSYALRGKQTEFCRKLLKKYVGDDDYDIAVVLADTGIISGAFVGMGKEKEIVILEDGMSDYFERANKCLLKNIFNMYDWQGFFVANMGYANPGHRYPLRTTRYCEKFCSNPDRMLYTDYKKIRRLFDMDQTDIKLYQDILSNIYEEISECNFEDAEVIVFTDRLMDFTTSSADEYVAKFETYINNNYKNIILKRHPRDDTDYKFNTDVKVYEIKSSIPGEVLLPYIGKTKLLFMYTTSILLYMGGYEYETSYLYFNQLYEKTKNESSHANYVTKEEMKECLDRFGVRNGNIIEI